ncbi:hypothetical protein HRR83_000351 [Exophiala dermatitidis]|uniref:Uncharacterized protein n=1 Tax=Exophiala dermatitidis TaxID=5970 RepID=A0AAN6F4R5_EXODE|nr:hypothetical protein HRR73_002887 [Exophiala dermatitidis]KAJ4527599.1 hypothetical protein HRR74_000353 [Exophiala dermatitidis]KAJ4531175.1 hypothetical protein HRR76_008849 [Exophiala dermatitidis]KAJ4558341.1 hypothetical protein HRR77_000352 [Exophiala dermatitidis]KAJ4581621.1 hypothetical protein HRR79_000641 [Exophiala dermatitidis]
MASNFIHNTSCAIGSQTTAQCRHLFNLRLCCCCCCCCCCITLKHRWYGSYVTLISVATTTVATTTAATTTAATTTAATTTAATTTAATTTAFAVVTCSCQFPLAQSSTALALVALQKVNLVGLSPSKILLPTLHHSYLIAIFSPPPPQRQSLSTRNSSASST